ncbi:hypothetical protein JZ751_021839 [Albula glossodonta]|uniref:t-SNARE coiled-coil homology domain-containing protein n=1 Tax=Albula glossodonta TaxID=121402 RepID=A0A8T2MT88_9TELE|nr:hypothetical protein JZ751_021839 [Albula glossodonta]
MSYGKQQPRDFNSLIQTCSSNIQRITQNNQEHAVPAGLQAGHPGAAGQTRQQKLQKERLMNDFSAALNNFQVVQRRAAEKEKESVARARAGSRLSAEDSNRDEQLVSFDNDGWGAQTQGQTEEAAITEEDLELIKERETNIRQLESDIMDVNQIFKDLAVMIHDQGEMIELFALQCAVPASRACSLFVVLFLPTGPVRSSVCCSCQQGYSLFDVLFLPAELFAL